MSAEVIVYGDETRRRSSTICEAMVRGIGRLGDKVEYRRELLYRKPEAEVAVFYGMSGNLHRIFDEYRAAGLTAVYIDLGYWSRRAIGARYTGYHKFSVNDRHPTAYFQKRKHDPARLAVHNVIVGPWRSEGKHVLVAGMGVKASEFEGFRHEEWERTAIGQIKAVTDRPIVYRPKPSCRQARPIDGTIYSPPTEGLDAVLADCHAVVTHHSNVAVDALLAGIPAFCSEGVAAPMSLRDVRRIEAPVMPVGREQWAADIAWTQWNLAEMTDGSAWRYLKDEGLVPS